MGVHVRRHQYVIDGIWNIIDPALVYLVVERKCELKNLFYGLVFKPVFSKRHQYLGRYG